MRLTMLMIFLQICCTLLLEYQTSAFLRSPLFDQFKPKRTHVRMIYPPYRPGRESSIERDLDLCTSTFDLRNRTIPLPFHNSHVFSLYATTVSSMVLCTVAGICCLLAVVLFAVRPRDAARERYTYGVSPVARLDALCVEHSISYLWRAPLSSLVPL